MVCELFGVKPLSEPIMAYCQLDPRDIHVHVFSEIQNTQIFFQENTFENVC